MRPALVLLALVPMLLALVPTSAATIGWLPRCSGHGVELDCWQCQDGMDDFECYLYGTHCDVDVLGACVIGERQGPQALAGAASVAVSSQV